MAATPYSFDAWNFHRGLHGLVILSGIFFFIHGARSSSQGSIHLIPQGHGRGDGRGSCEEDGFSSLPEASCVEEVAGNLFTRRHQALKISCFREESATGSDDSHGAAGDGGGSRRSNIPGIEAKFAADGSSSPQVKISPPSLDWGIGHLFSPSKIFLTVTNNHSEISLLVHEPFISDPQFYASGSWPLALKPGESSSIGFIFLPRFLGSSSAHLVLQTDRGGFIIHASGEAVESPYELRPLLGFEPAPDGTLRKAVRLHNPLEDDEIQVEEVRARVSVFFKNGVSLSAGIICQREKEPLSLDGKRFWFSFQGAGYGDLFMGLKPLENWEIPPRSSATLVDVSLFSAREGNFSGAVCLKLRSSSHGGAEIAVFPLEAQATAAAAAPPPSSISVFFELAPPHSKPVFSLYIRNGDSHPLKLEKIVGVNVGGAHLLEIKSMAGLILFPGALTFAALAAFTSAAVDPGCKLVALTNHSLTPQLEILCLDLLKSKSTAHPGVDKSTDIEGFDEMMVDDWRSQATGGDVSVLEQRELVFPGQLSRWVKVNNPTQKPVLVQLMLNSAAVVDRCREVDISSPESPLTGHGFSLAASAVTEALVHPLGVADLGPVDFRPLDQCRWRSSVLVRSNLSGVEWVLLRAVAGAGGPPVVLLQGSEPVDRLEFNLRQPPDLNSSSSSSSFCSRLFSKEITAKNVGESAVEVVRVDISGNGCWFEGFMVQDSQCLGFVLQPGESAPLVISFRPNFSAAEVQGHLRLVLAGGPAVELPLKAVLPLATLRLCEKPGCGKQQAFSEKLPLLALLAGAVAVAGLVRRLPHLVPPDSSSRSPEEEEGKPETTSAVDLKLGIRTQEAKRPDADLRKSTRSSSPSPSSPAAKDRSRRRRRKVSGSSKSSAPSSPASPENSSPDQVWQSAGAAVEGGGEAVSARVDEAVTSEAAEISPAKKPSGRPVLQHSASFPGAGTGGAAVPGRRAIAPEARAPGSRLKTEQTTAAAASESGGGEELQYDIWGNNHFCHRLIGCKRTTAAAAAVAAVVAEEEIARESQSFFARDPETLMMMAAPPGSVK